MSSASSVWPLFLLATLVGPLPYDLRFVRQPPGQGSADAVKRARATPPYLVTAADTVFAEGDVGRFAAAAVAHDGAASLPSAFSSESFSPTSS